MDEFGAGKVAPGANLHAARAPRGDKDVSIPCAARVSDRADRPLGGYMSAGRRTPGGCPGSSEGGLGLDFRSSHSARILPANSTTTTSLPNEICMKMKGFGETYVILVEHPEAGPGELGGVSMWKELLVDAQETRLGQLPVRTVFPEALVPLSDLALGDWPRPGCRGGGGGRRGRDKVVVVRPD